MTTNRTHETAYLSKGEKSLIVRALKHYIHDHQQMIQEAHAKFAAKQPVVFADHRQHHEAAIKAADDLLDRFRSRTLDVNPDLLKG